MKPKTPEISFSTLKELYAASQKIFEEKPWEVLDDLDLIAVRNPVTNETGYGAFMGSGGTLFGFCFYRGANGFYTYKSMIQGSIYAEDGDFFALHDCLKLEYVSSKELEREDLSLLKQLGITVKGRKPFPQFRSLTLGYAPWFLNESETKFLTLGLNAGLYHFEKILDDEAEDSLLENEILVYTPTDDSGTSFHSEWESFPELPSELKAQPILNLPRINALRAKRPKQSAVWEAGAFYLPSTIFDRERPYYTHLAVVCEQSKGIVLAVETILPEQFTEQVLAETLCSVIEKHNIMPQKIFVKSDDLAAALQPLANALGFAIQQKEELRTLTMVKEGLYEQLMNGNFGGGRRR